MKAKLFLIFAIATFSIYLISSAAISPTTFSVNPDINKNYILTINNNDIWPDGNITVVNITVPTGLVYIDKSNSTTSSYATFLNDSNLLSWENSSDDGYLINGTNSKTFSFEANGSTLGGIYNITLLIISNNTHSIEYNSTVTIEDTTDPSINFNSPTPISNSNLAQTFIPVEVSASDNVAIDTITIFIYGSTGLLSNSSGDSSPHSINFTGLIDGTYSINATVTDTSGNEDSTSTRIITLNLSSTTTSQPTNTNTTPTNTTSSTPPVCTPNWDCGDWKPKKCKEGEIQEKICTDLNDCSGDGSETTLRNCVNGGSSLGKVLVTSIGVVILLIIIAITIFYIKGKFGLGSQLNNMAPKGPPPVSMPKINFPRRKMRIPRLPRRAPMNSPGNAGRKLPLRRAPPRGNRVPPPRRPPQGRNPRNKPL